MCALHILRVPSFTVGLPISIATFVYFASAGGYSLSTRASAKQATRSSSLRLVLLSVILVQRLRGLRLFVPYLGVSVSLIPSIFYKVGIASPLQDHTDCFYVSTVLTRTLVVYKGASSYQCNPFKVLRFIAKTTKLPSTPLPRSLSVSAGFTRIYPTRVNPTYCCLLVEVFRDFHKAGYGPLQSGILPTGFSINAEPAVSPKPFPY